MDVTHSATTGAASSLRSADAWLLLFYGCCHVSAPCATVPMSGFHSTPGLWLHRCQGCGFSGARAVASMVSGLWLQWCQGCGVNGVRAVPSVVSELWLQWHQDCAFGLWLQWCQDCDFNGISCALYAGLVVSCLCPLGWFSDTGCQVHLLCGSMVSGALVVWLNVIKCTRCVGSALTVSFQWY